MTSQGKQNGRGCGDGRGGTGESLARPTGEGLPRALLNRLVVVPFYPVNKEMLRTIIKMNLSRYD